MTNTENKYTAKVAFTSKPISFEMKMKLKNITGATPLSDAIDDAMNALIIYPYFYAVVEVHNPKVKDRETGQRSEKDYEIYVIADKSGVMYTTSSQSFIESLSDLTEEWSDAQANGEIPEDKDLELKCFKVQSQNNSGKFITCTIA